MELVGFSTIQYEPFSWATKAKRNVLLSEISDENLMHMFLLGNEEAFAALVHRYEHLLFSVAYQMLLDEYLAQDVCQHAWLQLFLVWPQRAGVSLKPWLLTVVKNRCIDEIRQRRKSALLFSCFELEGGEDRGIDSIADTALLPEEILVDQEQCGKVQLAIEQLPVHMHSVLRLRIYDAFSIVEIACFLSLTNANAKARLYRALPLLRKTLELQSVKERE